MNEPGSRRPPSRQNKVLVAGHFPRPVAKRLRHMAVEGETTVQALLGEAIDDLFVKHQAAKHEQSDSALVEALHQACDITREEAAALAESIINEMTDKLMLDNISPAERNKDGDH